MGTDLSDHPHSAPINMCGHNSTVVVQIQISDKFESKSPTFIEFLMRLTGPFLNAGTCGECTIAM